jgi:DNA invertase Pin-like site-specific DNA recombinase
VSLRLQRERIRDYARLYDLEIVGMFSDEGVGGGNLKREGLSRVFTALESGEADAVIVLKIDRLTRSLKDLLDLVSRYFNGAFSLFSVVEHLDPRTPAGRLTMNILAAVAQWEVETIRERTKSAMANKRSKGEFTGGAVPFGWVRVRGGVVEKVVKDPSEQLVVSLAKSLAQTGMSLRVIGAELSKVGMFPRQGARWSAEQVRRLLKANQGEV